MSKEHQPEPTDEEDPREAEDRFPREETFDASCHIPGLPIEIVMEERLSGVRALLGSAFI